MKFTHQDTQRTRAVLAEAELSGRRLLSGEADTTAGDCERPKNQLSRLIS